MSWIKPIAALAACFSVAATPVASSQVGQDMADFWLDLNGYGNVSGPSSHDLQRGG